MLLVLLLLLAIILIFSIKPLLALFHQGQAGRALGEVVAVGDNEYGGFACLRPFVEDLQQRESLQTALTHLRKAESFAPNQSHTYLLLGRTFCLLGDYESAIPAFQKFGELRPKNPLGYLEMGFALLQARPPNGKCPDGLNTYDAWRKAGVRAEDFLALAERARQKEDYATALLWYQNAQRMGMELRSTVAYIRYITLKQAGKKEEADQALRTAIDIDRGWVDNNLRFVAWNYYGRSLFYKHNFKKAKQIIKFAISMYSDFDSQKSVLSDLYRYLAVSSLYLDEKAEAISYIAEAKDANPSSVWAHLQYGWILYKIDPRNAHTTLQEFERGLELAKKDKFIWKSVIELCVNLNREDWVIMFCQRANQNGIKDIEGCSG